MARGIYRKTYYHLYRKKKKSYFRFPLSLPLVPTIGDRYIIPAFAIGAWAGRTNHIAELSSLGPTVWAFTIPKKGYSIYIKDENEHYKFNGSNWELW